MNLLSLLAMSVLFILVIMIAGAAIAFFTGRKRLALIFTCGFILDLILFLMLGNRLY